jgi:DNA replication protein DnaC
MFEEAIQGLVKAAIAANPNADKMFMGEDGLLRCGVCGEPVQQRLEAAKRFLEGGICPRPCRCLREAYAKLDEEENRRKAEEKVAQLQKLGFTDATYMRHTFESDSGNSPQAREAAEWYVDNFHELRKNGVGMMFMGNPGTGKTFYACCIANALIQKGVAVWVTTMQPLLRKANDFKTADELFERVQTAELLILDDFGTSQNSPRNLELLFEIIDTRARSGLPLIVTTNLAPADLKNAPLELQRIYSRIKEMCLSGEKSRVILSGEDMRLEKIRRVQKAVG